MTATLPPPPPALPPPAQPVGPPPGKPSFTTGSHAVPFSERLAAARRNLRASNATLDPVTRALVWTFGVLAALALWLVLFGLVLSGLVESHAQGNLYDSYRAQLAAGVAPIGGAIAEGAPVALLNSPRGGLHNLVAVEGSSASELRSGPGHRPGTPLPGQAGVALFLGRATSFGAPFGNLTDLRAGDTITATTGQGVFTYTVQDVRRPGDPLPPVLAAGAGRLTLVTAAGDGWRSGWAPSYAIYVDALLKGTAAAAPAQGSIPSVRDNVLTHDTRGLYPLVLWLQLLLVAAVGGVWLRARWGSSRALLIALPVGFAALWGASQSGWLLLPNLL